MPADLICVFWGPLFDRELHHHSCGVVLRNLDEVATYKGKRLFDPPRIPMVCSCECQTCKRAWWDQGRPIIREDGTLRRVWDRE